jgi:hypothetical protein
VDNRSSRADDEQADNYYEPLHDFTCFLACSMACDQPRALPEAMSNVASLMIWAPRSVAAPWLTAGLSIQFIHFDQRLTAGGHTIGDGNGAGLGLLDNRDQRGVPARSLLLGGFAGAAVNS